MKNYTIICVVRHKSGRTSYCAELWFNDKRTSTSETYGNL